ncbi:MAG: hypothetical protein H7174_01675 [Flavobacterium sp.]|nr:hypothetical protein [Flavobacterium sp.]
MKFKILGSILLIVSMLSCKNDKSNPETLKPEVVTSKDNFYKVSFNLIVSKDDNFHLYYTHDGSINFNEKESIWMPIKGGESVQTVTFVFPEAVIPTQIRVDFGFGKNELQSDVNLKSFKMSYRGKSMEAKDTDILSYFIPFEGYTLVTTGTSVLKRLKKDQESGPILYPKQKLSLRINEITSGGSQE